MQRNQNITKSIVYGNHYKNNYGIFLPICSAITQKAHVDRIVDYLRSNKHFSQYNRYAYAYRVQEIPIVFITENRNQNMKFYEGQHSDDTIEGSGHKLLHLLQKLNIRNVFIGVIIQQYDPLRRFETTIYRTMVESAKQLLNTLYRKVINAQQQQLKNQPNLILNTDNTVQLKKCIINEQVFFPQIKSKEKIVKDRPNHIYSQGKPNFLNKSSTNSYLNLSNKAEIKFLKERIHTFQIQYDKLIHAFQQKDLQQLKFMVTYDKNTIVNMVFVMLEIIEDIPRDQLINQYNFKNILTMQLNKLNSKQARKISDMLISHKFMIVDNIMRISKCLGLLFSMIDLMLRNYKASSRIEDLKNMKEIRQVTEEIVYHGYKSNKKINIKQEIK